MQKLICNKGSVPFYKTGAFLAFTLGTLSLLVTILPIIILEKGYFIYYGDFNAQQMPFNYLASSAVSSGEIGWSWTTDLGSNFIGSYAFYLFGSPFFWLTAWLPASWAAHLLPFVLSLKHGFAAMTAYAYIKRFVKKRETAIIGGMLYAFSGFQIYNIFFNHFQDVTALFPLMLIAMEELVKNNRRGVFALTTAIMASVSYFFFTGEAVFLVIYFAVRCFSDDFPASVKKFFTVLLEAVIGVMLACVILLPAALAILSNYRIGEHLFGLDMVLYNDRTRLMRIIQSFFMIPDAPARPNLFAESLGKWSSIGGYLPLFSMTGVIAFMKHRDGHWAKRIIIICMICAFIPILNSGFYTFNSSYYARWFFMPVLIMALATACVLDSEGESRIPMKEGLWITGGITAAFGIISLLPEKNKDGSLSFFTIPEYPWHFLLVFAIAVLFIVLTAVIAKKLPLGKIRMRTVLILTTAGCIACTASMIYFCALTPSDAYDYIDKAIDSEDDVTIEADSEDFFRIDVSEHKDNYSMFWGLPNMRCFHSVVPGSIMEFYAETGIGRDVASRAGTEYYALRGLFSVKYYFDEIPCEDDEDEEPVEEFSMAGFEFSEEMNGFKVYENKAFIPMGFTFDNYIKRSDWKKLPEDDRTSVLIKALVLEDEDASEYGSLMKELPESERKASEKEYISECRKRAASSCSSFSYDSGGFMAEINTDDDKLVFFSVPFDDGFTAYVNGSETDIIKADAGFSAVFVPKGKSSIEFKYHTPGLRAGALVSAAGLAVFAGYILICAKFKKKEKQKNAS